MRNTENLTNDEKKLAMKEGNFLIIYDFMIKKLNLNMSEYLIYALIYSYSREGLFLHATKTYIAEKLNTSVRTIYRTLRSLKEKNLIYEVPTDIGYNRYAIGYAVNQETLMKIPGLENFATVTYEASHKRYGFFKNVRLTLRENLILTRMMGDMRLSRYIRILDRKILESPELDKKNPNHYAIIMNYYKNDEAERKDEEDEESDDSDEFDELEKSNE